MIKVGGFMKSIYNKITALFLSLIVIILTITFLFKNNTEFSENENRYLQLKPKFSFNSLIKGEFISKVEDYFADQFPFRDGFMNIKTSVDKLLGKKDINDVYLAQNDYLIEKYKNPINSDKIIKTLNNFQKDINYVNLNLMLVPTSISINSDLLPKNVEYQNQMTQLNYIYQKITFNTINVYDALLKQNKYYQMFYRLDHHWTSYGAYYAYLEYAKANNIDYLSINDFKIEEVTKEFNGTLYSKSNDYSKKPDSIHLFIPKKHNYKVEYVFTKKTTDSLYEKSYLDKKDKYSMFLDNNHPLIVITNKDIKNNSEIVVIKDSYANSFIPFLVNHFSKVHVIDPRFYHDSISEYIKNNKKIKDALILYNMNTLDKDLGILTLE